MTTVLALVCLLAGASPPAAPPEKLAVFIVGASDRDQAIGDGLTEVVIGRLARTRAGRLVGTAEIRHRLRLRDPGEALRCLEDVGCLSTAGVSLGVSRIVTGTVADGGGRFMLSLRLTNLVSGQIEGRYFRVVPGTLADLVGAAQDGVDALFVAPPPSPGLLRISSRPSGARVLLNDAFMGTTPLGSTPVPPGRHTLRVELERHRPWSSRLTLAPGEEFSVALGPRELPPRRTWMTWVGYGTLGLASATATAGAVFGALSQIEPSGQTARQAQRDLFMRRDMARAANILFVASASTLLVAGVFYLRSRD